MIILFIILMFLKNNFQIHASLILVDMEKTHYGKSISAPTTQFPSRVFLVCSAALHMKLFTLAIKDKALRFQ